MEPYPPGTKVKILIGHPIYQSKRYAIECNNFFNGTNIPVPEEGADELMAIDGRPELVGKEAIVEYHTVTQGIIHYSINVDGDRMSWFTSKQIELC